MTDSTHLISYTIDESDSDRICIHAKIDDTEVGVVILEILFDAMSEFEGAINDEEISEAEVDRLFPDNTIQSINHLKVNDNWLRRGIGDGLMNQALDYFELHGNETIYLNACPMGHGISLPDLVEFYESYGFKQIIHGGPNIEMVRAA